jgi:hypothetical protein
MIDKIRKIKYLRMKPEERYVYDIVTNLVEYYHPSYLHKKYYKHNDELLFDYNLENGYFGCHYRKFWSILENDFSMNYQQVQSFVKLMVEEHIIKKDVTTLLNKLLSAEGVEEHIIKKDVTTQCRSGCYLGLVEEHIIKKDVTTGLSKTVLTGKVEEHIIKKDVTPFVPVECYFDIKGQDIIKKEVKPIGIPRLKETESEKDLIKKDISPECEEWGEMDGIESQLIKNN